MKSPTLRLWCVRLLYASIAAHLLVGGLLPLMGDASFLDGYHRAIETAFHGPAIPEHARAHQLWWIALFGPTVQAAAIWMAALAVIGDREKSSFAWGALIAGMLLWAPQDMAISLQRGVWTHVWIDMAALAIMLPPLYILFFIDREKASA